MLSTAKVTSEQRTINMCTKKSDSLFTTQITLFGRSTGKKWSNQGKEQFVKSPTQKPEAFS